MGTKTNRMKLVVVGIVVVAVGGGRTKADFTFGQPVNLGPTVNSSSNDSCPYISADGLQLYLASGRDGGAGGSDIWCSTRETTEAPWGPPENLGSPINTSGEEWYPTVSGDGLEMYFNRYYFDENNHVKSSILVTRRTTQADPWAEPVALDLLGDGLDNEGDQDLSADGLELYFTNFDQAEETAELFVVRRETIDSAWGGPVSLGPIVNGGGCQVTGRISNDGLMLVFADWWGCSPRIGGSGDRDMWISRRITQDSEWSEPVNLGPPANSLYVEITPMISADDSTLYFCSTRPGGPGEYNLWQATIVPVVDFDDDGEVGINDLLTMIESWGTDNTLCDIGPMPWGDGVVDRADLEVFMEHWGQITPIYIVVDDFESYTDDVNEVTFEGTTIWNTWIDGLWAGTSGAIVGHEVPPFAETIVVHRGFQAMPLFYDNDGTIAEGSAFEMTGVPYYSETQRTWADPQDWTREGVEILTLWFHGDPGNSVEPFYVALEDSAGNRKDIEHPDPAALTIDDWKQWRIPLTDFTDVDPTAIKIMSIGVGDPASTEPGGAGVVYIDDIELHRPSGQ